MMFSGWFDLPWWGLILVALALTHVTIAAVTIFLHRCQAHRALELHPLISQRSRHHFSSKAVCQVSFRSGAAI